MIDRVHFFKLRDVHSDAPTRDRLAEAVRAALAPHGWAIRIGLPADIDAAKAWDLMVQVSFPDDAEASSDTTLEVLDAALATARDRMEVEKHWSFVRH